MAVTSFLLLVCLTTGYLAVSTNKYGRFFLNKRSSAEGYIYILALGLLLTTLSFIAAALFLELGNGLLSTKNSLIDFTALFSANRSGEVDNLAIVGLVLWPPVFGFVVSKLVGVTMHRKRPYQHVEKSIDDEFDARAFKALVLNSSIDSYEEQDGSLNHVRVVMDNRKVYIGSLLRCDVEHGQTKNLVIAPLYSGYLNADTLALELPEDYVAHYLEIKKELTEGGIWSDHDEKRLLERFSVIIPVENVDLLSFFDVNAYRLFLERKAKSLEEELEQAS